MHLLIITGKGFLLKLKDKVYTSCIRNCFIYVSETWPLKVEHETELDRNEVVMLRWMCGFSLMESKKNTEVRELLRLEPVSLLIRRSWLQWFGQVELNSDWSSDVCWWRFMELDRVDVQGRLVWIVSQWMRRVLACPVRMLRIGISGDWKSWGNWLTRVNLLLSLWLPIWQWVTYKLAFLVHKCVNGRTLEYLAEFCHPCVDQRPGLRSADSGKLHIPRTQTSFGDRSFAVAGPRTWNNLPDAIRDSSLSFLTFTKLLKSYLFVWLLRCVWFLTGAL